jgi:hypothetical protein
MREVARHAAGLRKKLTAPAEKERGQRVTIPYERTQALLMTRQLLRELADGAHIEPDVLQRRAVALLRHYPDALHVALSSEHLPGVWADPQGNA